MKAVITGGAGFVGCNAASRYLGRGDQVVVIDNLQRAGTASNLKWLEGQGALEFVNADVRDRAAIDAAFLTHRDAALILHLAGQVAVTTSIADPRLDFEINALGTLNVLEAVRRAGIQAPFIYASTNKVYGEMTALGVEQTLRHYAYSDLPHGISEDHGLDFHSPYGCSKGSADQYVRDYHRIYGLNTVVFRQSCIYGTRQFGMEDQGWVAWFIIACELGFPLRIYGDGKQVRDVLYIDDLLDAFDAAAASTIAAGRVYNIGGGAGNAISLLDLIEHLEQRLRLNIDYARAPWRPGDQRVYISDIRRAGRELNWQPRVEWRAGVNLVAQWVRANRDHCRAAFAIAAASPQAGSE